MGNPFSNKINPIKILMGLSSPSLELANLLTYDSTEYLQINIAETIFIAHFNFNLS